MRLPLTRIDAPRFVIVGAIFLTFGSLFVGSLIDHSPNVGADTRVLVGGARVAVHCLRAGTLKACGTAESARAHETWPFKTAVGDWPPSQYLIAIPLVFAGAGNTTIYTALALINVLAFLLTGLLLVTVARRIGQRDTVPLLVLLLLTSPFLFYATSTLGESLASFVGIAAVAAVAVRARPALIAVATCASTITKESAVIFAVGLGLLVALRQDGVGKRMRVAAVIYGGLIGLFIIGLFNYFRYGTLRNQDLLLPIYHVPTYGFRANFFAALLISPNGGILEYWPAAILTLVGVASFAVIRNRRRRIAILPLLLLVLFVVLLAGLADWWTPFGWYAWGPRLTLPWMLPFCLAAVVSFPEEVRAIQQFAFGSYVRAALVTGILLLAALPQIAVGFYIQATAVLFFQNHWCQPGYQPPSHAYYRCVSHEAWAHKPVLFTALHGIWTKPGLPVTLAFAALIVSLGALAHLDVGHADLDASASRRFRLR